MKRKPFKLICLILVAFFLVITIGCFPKRQVVLTQDQESERVYYEALNTFVMASNQFTFSLVKYNNWCEQPGYEEVCKMVDPYWDKANKAIMAWEAIIDSRKADTFAQDNYVEALKALKTKMLMELPTYTW